MVGGLAGTAVEHAAGRSQDAFEYIVRKSGGELLSVTQVDAKPLVLGQKVLVITGNQARIVPDYTVAMEPRPKPAAAAASQAPREARRQATRNPPLEKRSPHAPELPSAATQAAPGAAAAAVGNAAIQLAPASASRPGCEEPSHTCP